MSGLPGGRPLCAKQRRTRTGQEGGLLPRAYREILPGFLTQTLRLLQLLKALLRYLSRTQPFGQATFFLDGAKWNSERVCSLLWQTMQALRVILPKACSAGF